MCVRVCVKNYKLPSFEGTAKTRCHVNNFACISHLSKAGFPATARPSAAPPPLLSSFCHSPLTICSALALFRSQRNSKFFTANRRLSLGCKWKTIKFIEITCCCLKCVVAHCVAACAGVVVVLHAAVALSLSLSLCFAVSVSFAVPVLAASFAIVNIKSQTVKPLLATHAYTHKNTQTLGRAYTHKHKRKHKQAQRKASGQMSFLVMRVALLQRVFISLSLPLSLTPSLFLSPSIPCSYAL